MTSQRKRIRDDLAQRVREIEHAWIPLADGARLAARIWLPEGAAASPAIVEYLPYRKRDRTRWRDEPMHRWFAGHGYAAVRIDVRGSGESDGLLLDEYSDQELADGVEALAWVAAQPWCTGATGMLGKSWGGFNALQIAALRPPSLKAVISVCAADDRYADDAHYMGGCLLNENLLWGSVLLTLSSLPPDPELVGAAWRGLWLRRMESLPLFAAEWMRHQRRDAYWRRGSVREDYRAIACPVYAVGGWADGYSNAVPRLLAGLGGVRKGLVGPWAHVYPHNGVPGPAIGFLQEALRWWERWLKGVPNGIEDEPAYRAWMQASAPPQPLSVPRSGRWVAEEAWPSARIETLRLALRPGRLADQAEAEGAPVERLEHRAPQTVGLAAGGWCGFGVDGDDPLDQREDDAGSLVFDGAPLAAPLEILGAPEVELELDVDRPLAFLAARLCEVLPDGTSARVTYGLLNLTHRKDHELLATVRPGERMRVRVRLNDVGHAFAPGSRLRLALSTSYWPVAWPSPEPVTLGVLTTPRSRLELPLRPPRPEDAALRPFAPPETAPASPETDLEPGGVTRELTRDPATGALEHVARWDTTPDGGVARTRLESIGLETGHAIVERFRIHPADPLAASTTIEHRALLRRGPWSTRVETRSRLTADRTHFHLEATLRAFEGEAPVVERSWSESIPRDGV